MLGVKLAVKASPVIAVKEVIGRSDFMALEEEWNNLVEATCDEPFYRHEFIRTWIDNFAPGAKLSILTGRDETGRLVAAFPLMKARGFVSGLPARQTVSTANPHSCRFDMIAEDGTAAGKSFLAYLAADKSWDMLKITDVPAGGNAWHLYKAAEAAGFPVGTWESQRSPYLPLPSSYDKLLETMSPGFRANLRRRRRRLGKLGTVTVERVTGGAHLQEQLEECFAIEQKGWKGLKGTAILQDTKTHGFYTQLAHIAASQNYLSLFLLKLNGQSIAFHYGFTYSGIYYMPKLGYDEAFEGGSPGLVLLEEIMKDCIGRGLKGCDFLGLDVPWKTDWSKQVCRHDWLFIYRDGAFGRALYEVKFKWIPAAKHLLLQFYGRLRPLVFALRAGLAAAATLQKKSMFGAEKPLPLGEADARQPREARARQGEA
jgi:CelD/BcsL family acetyltransferase involved in cellulose biosynthesis